MTLALGVDTGGTFTDAVLIRDGRDVLAKGKSLTTRSDLAVGIGNAVQNVLKSSGVSATDVGFSALSTTLATNALVEGQGGRVGLVYIGFRKDDLDKHGLNAALKGDPACVLAGGHGHSGSEATPMDLDGLRAWLMGVGAGMSAYAVASQFATRNPAHEQAAADLIGEVTGKPVTQSHHLSAKLNGPKRAVTAVLNARLVGMIDRLIGSAERILQDIGVGAPIMVVRGDGALMSAAQAKARPIETILSGPAASLVGAHWLTGLDTALVSDIGGTTTDVAVLRSGRPLIDPQGAKVGDFRTMVEAVAIRTTGLGGDSETHVQQSGLSGGLRLGPRRVVPVSLIAHEHPDIVHNALDLQLSSLVPNEYDTRFVRRISGPDSGGLNDREATLLARIDDAPVPMAEALRNRRDAGVLERLIDRGLLQVCGVTPSDAAHVVGRHDAWDADAALKALTVLARKRGGHGNAIAKSAFEMADQILAQLTEQSKQAVLEATFAEEVPEIAGNVGDLARHPLMRAGLGQHAGLIEISVRLGVDLIGLGASAATYYPDVGRALNCVSIVPENADVANAIGAVVGQVVIRKSSTITAPSAGRFRAHLSDGTADFPLEAEAMSAVERDLRQLAAAEANDVTSVQENIHYEVKRADIEGRSVFVEAIVTLELSGRPRFASDIEEG